MEKFIDNFDAIKKLLDFKSEDDFYFVQILQRKKEHPELGSNSRVVKTYYIKNEGHFDALRNEIKKLCAVFNARAYIHPTKRSFERITYQTLKMVTDYIMQPDFSHAHRCWESACGKFSSGDKRWVVDIDKPDMEKYGLDITEFEDYILTLRPEDISSPVLARIPTKNGYHLITKPFNTKIFGDKFPDIQVHKNNPTLLFAVNDMELVNLFNAKMSCVL